MSSRRTPTALIILDGYGDNPSPDNNAIFHARTPVMDRLRAELPTSQINTDGMHVGLPDGQMGNSEVGHMNLGAGRVVYQDFTRVTQAIRDGSFYDNAALCEAVDQATSHKGAVHLMGLLSPGGVHSHEEHLFAMAELAVKRGASQVYLHAFLDGRDMPPRSAEASLLAADEAFRKLGTGRVASLVGRYYAMDRDNRWDRVEKAYNLLTLGQAEFSAESAVAGLQAAYARDENDEFVQPTVIGQPVQIEDGDAVIFMNFRADRAREISRAFVEPEFKGFARRAWPRLSRFVMLTQYADDIPAAAAFPPENLSNTFGEYLASLGKTQLRIAETEKYAHVTFFFSGGREQPFEGETRILVQSPQVATYDLQPEMSAPEVTERLVQAILSGDYDAIICNYANGDMVGHTGDFAAAVKAVEALDACIGRVIEALQQVNGQCFITADHGNAEQMLDESTGQAQTAHTTFPVPLIYLPPAGRKARLLDGGRLSDIAPTLLKAMGLPQPPEMTGHPLVEFEPANA
ncbi:2,3-bisphosphoglycerate-independent phosphoglycerate mutase [Marinospirillum alkaliphilum]|uniref:2,3-bisphosphoglycerate-independent phosphoglycerate mutase n=1 Tax=Marinospirillum alkaliphilum DSM 21637 TaxID=1122209 RepID=A0A1K1WPM2_9GAMM|nr:2,3-bisphosphoglycerate-independent phosphoglycerate mutase [Marinospirillum alkaliphilum]SFX39344.1 phosphoglycerate mutase [Marinospirillum alkaliphilum DSM 21637]